METEITSLLNTVAPLKTGHRTGPRKAKNWLSPDGIEAKKRRRRLERRWKASNAESDRLTYRSACSSTNKLINKSLAASNIESINETFKNPKCLWSTIKSLLHSSPPSEQLSPSISQPLANSFASFFHQKIVALKESISLKLLGNPSPFDFDQPHCNELLSDFMPVTPAEVSKLLQSMSNKSSQLDYIPTSLLKSCADIFSILISHLANLSFTLATFPAKFKLAWKRGMELKGLRVNIGTTKVMRCQVRIGQAEETGKYPCGVCRQGVGDNSIKCVACHKWVHKRCSGISGGLGYVADFRCKRCLEGDSAPVVLLSEVELEPGVKVECVSKFCYLGDTPGSGGGVVEAARARVRCAWVKFKELSPIFDCAWCIISYQRKDL